VGGRAVPVGAGPRSVPTAHPWGRLTCGAGPRLRPPRWPSPGRTGRPSPGRTGRPRRRPARSGRCRTYPGSPGRWAATARAGVQHLMSATHRGTCHVLSHPVAGPGHRGCHAARTTGMVAGSTRTGAHPRAALIIGVSPQGGCAGIPDLLDEGRGRGSMSDRATALTTTAVAMRACLAGGMWVRIS
jgi:hypothetical protein